MRQAARGADEPALPTRYVFDEGHQLFPAADDTFSLRLSGREAAELRRWLGGAEDGRRLRRRGLKERAEDLFERHPAANADGFVRPHDPPWRRFEKKLGSR